MSNICPEHVETFFTLLRDPNHWAFEILLMLVFDGLIGALALPFIKKHWLEHASSHHNQPTVQELLMRIEDLEQWTRYNENPIITRFRQIDNGED